MTAYHGISGDRAGEAGEDGVDLDEERRDAVEHAVAAAVGQRFQALLRQRRADVAQQVSAARRQQPHRLRRQQPHCLLSQQMTQHLWMLFFDAWHTYGGAHVQVGLTLAACIAVVVHLTQFNKQSKEKCLKVREDARLEDKCPFKTFLNTGGRSMSSTVENVYLNERLQDHLQHRKGSIALRAHLHAASGAVCNLFVCNEAFVLFMGVQGMFLEEPY